MLDSPTARRQAHSETHHPLEGPPTGPPPRAGASDTHHDAGFGDRRGPHSPGAFLQRERQSISRRRRAVRSVSEYSKGDHKAGSGRGGNVTREARLTPAPETAPQVVPLPGTPSAQGSSCTQVAPTLTGQGALPRGSTSHHSFVRAQTTPPPPDPAHAGSFPLAGFRFNVAFQGDLCRPLNPSGSRSLYAAHHLRGAFRRRCNSTPIPHPTRSASFPAPSARAGCVCCDQEIAAQGRCVALRPITSCRCVPRGAQPQAGAT